MGVTLSRFEVETQGREEMIDITDRVAEATSRLGMQTAVAVIFALHTTVGLIIVENETGLLEDLREALRRIAPQELPYQHNRLDDNGHSHIRAALLGPSLVVPVSEGRLLLGTWQRILLLEFDTRPRVRQVVVQVVGD